MLLRLVAAIVTAANQSLILWIAVYFSVRIAQIDDFRRHHYLQFGLLIYFLLIYSWAAFAVLNLSSAIVNRKWFTWTMAGLCLGFEYVLFFPMDRGDTPLKSLFFIGVIVPLISTTLVQNNFCMRLLVRMLNVFKRNRRRIS